MSERTNDLTVRQGDVLDVIAAQLHSRAQVPTYKEIGEALGITSTHGVYCHVRALRKKGYLHPSEGKSRGLRLTRKGLGRIRRQAAALPRHASQVGTTVYIDGRLGGADVRNRRGRVLRVGQVVRHGHARLLRRPNAAGQGESVWRDASGRRIGAGAADEYLKVDGAHATKDRML